MIIKEDIDEINYTALPVLVQATQGLLFDNVVNQ